MPTQVFSWLDYCGPLAVGGAFSIGLLLVSICMQAFFIRKFDDVTTFEKLGARMNLRLGPHRLSEVRRNLLVKPTTDEAA